MRILKIIHGYPPLYNAGSEVYSQSICDELSKRHEVAVFTREENPFAPDFTIRSKNEHERLSIHLANMARGKDGFRHNELDMLFTELVRSFRPDVAHIGHLNHLTTGIVDVLHDAGVPIVFTLHDFWLMCPRGQFLQRNFGEGRLHELCDRQENAKCANTCYGMFHTGTSETGTSDSDYWTAWIADRMAASHAIIDKADVFIAPSHHLLNRFVSVFGMPKEKVIYLDYGFPTHYLKPNVKKMASEKFRFGYIGTHIPAKGVNLLIEAFDGVSDRAELYIWGAKDAQSTNALRAIAEGVPNISFMGAYVNSNLADEVFSRVDCIVVPSIWTENSPLVIHEAQACQIPVITADVGGMAEYVQHQVNGLLFRHRDNHNLKQQMVWAVEHQEAMQVLGKRGYLYSEDGSIPDIVSHCQQLELIYGQVIAKR
jgi:glycosyltransferase involved in cell wall biosynthesis